MLRIKGAKSDCEIFGGILRTLFVRDHESSLSQTEIDAPLHTRRVCGIHMVLDRNRMDYIVSQTIKNREVCEMKEMQPPKQEEVAHYTFKSD